MLRRRIYYAYTVKGHLELGWNNFDNWKISLIQAQNNAHLFTCNTPERLKNQRGYDPVLLPLHLQLENVLTRFTYLLFIRSLWNMYMWVPYPPTSAYVKVTVTVSYKHYHLFLFFVIGEQLILSLSLLLIVQGGISVVVPYCNFFLSMLVLSFCVFNPLCTRRLDE